MKYYLEIKINVTFPEFDCYTVVLRENITVLRKSTTEILRGKEALTPVTYSQMVQKIIKLRVHINSKHRYGISIAVSFQYA